MNTRYIAGWLHRTTSPLYDAVIANDTQQVTHLLQDTPLNVHSGYLEMGATDGNFYSYVITPLMAVNPHNHSMFLHLLAHYSTKPEYYLPSERSKSDLSEVIRLAATHRRWQRVLACSDMLKHSTHYHFSGPAHTALRKVIYAQLEQAQLTRSIDPATLMTLLENELCHYLLQNKQRQAGAFNTSIGGVAVGVMRFRVFGRSVMLGGYSAREKHAAATLLLQVLRHERSPECLKQHQGALHNGKLGKLTALVTAYQHRFERPTTELTHLML